MNARDFVLSLADQLIEQGREVEIEEDPGSIRIYAPSRTLMENAIGANAAVMSGTGRWAFCGIRAHTRNGDTVRDMTRKRASAIIRIYGKSYLPAGATA